MTNGLQQISAQGQLGQYFQILVKTAQTVNFHCTSHINDKREIDLPLGRNANV